MKLPRYLLLVILSVFFVGSNNAISETTKEKAERRMPPVLSSLEMPEQLISGVEYTIRWSMLGYHDNYRSIIAFFNCRTTPDDCGANSGQKEFHSGRLSPVSSEDGAWTYSGVQSRLYHYEYTFTPNVDISTDYVIRFYRINSIDDAGGKSTLSLLLPGGLPNVSYHDTSGRMLQKTIQPESGG